MRLDLAASSVDSVEKGTLGTVPPQMACRKSQVCIPCYSKQSNVRKVSAIRNNTI